MELLFVLMVLYVLVESERDIVPLVESERDIVPLVESERDIVPLVESECYWLNQKELYA